MPRLALLLALILAPTLRAADPDPFDQSRVPIEELPTDPKLTKIVLIAGLPTSKLKSGEHEYFAGCALLWKMLKQTPGVFPVVARDGWPTKPETLTGAKAVVLFLEGGDVHPALKGERIAQLQKLADAGAGIVHLHSAIDYPKDLGDRVRGLAGAHWEKGYSQRAHWVAAFDTFPDHPICRGVTKFEVNDGWLWKLRFVPEMKGVTPLLRTTSPKAIGKTPEPEPVVSWAYERHRGGRSFTFTGGHLHESWGQEGYRRFLVNGILWSAGLEVPGDGAPVKLDPAELMRHLDRKPADKPVTHAFLATGGQTYIRSGDGQVTWRYPQASRDGWVLPDGHVLLALSKSKEYPGGAAVEVTRDGKVVFEFKGTLAEVNTVQPLDGGRVLVTEAGNKPRLLEVDRDGTVAVEVPLKAQTKDHHLQTRMARKLANGNYLVPQLLDKVVREYTPRGEVVWEVKTPDMPFTAIRLDNGNTLIGCTLGHLVIEVNKDGKEVWRVTNDDLPGRPINDACGVQRLPNGNTVITSHHAGADDVKLTEVTRDRKVVWSHKDPKAPGIHHFQILDTNGKPIEGRPLK
jgi:type 1 glutamine amidotransferase